MPISAGEMTVVPCITVGEVTITHLDPPARKATRKKRGRPKGSKTTAKKTVTRPSAHCPTCHATAYDVIKKLNEQPYAGITSAGDRYTSIIKRSVQCRHCKQRFIVRDYPFDPSKWT